MKEYIDDSYRMDSIAAGAIAGLVGGILMGLSLMILSGVSGMGFLHPIELAGSTFYGVEAILGGTGPLVAGILVHLGSTSLLGALFGALLPMNQQRKATSWGVFYGIFCWALVTFMALPLLNSTMQERVEWAPGWWFLSFLLYGSVLGNTPRIRVALTYNVDTPTYEERKRVA